MESPRLQEHLSKALSVAHTAVAADSAGDYNVALDNYRTCISALRGVEHSIADQAILDKLREQASKYDSRVAIIEQFLISEGRAAIANKSLMSPNRPASSYVEPVGSRVGAPTIIGGSPDLRNHAQSARAAAALTPVGTVANSSTDDVTLLLGEWQEDTTYSQKAPTPMPRGQVNEKALWLIDAIFQSMIEGSYLNKRIYVTKDVWFQKGVKFPNTQPKLAYLESLCAVLEKVQQSFAQNADLQKEELSKELDVIQTKLAKHVSYIKSKNADVLVAGGDDRGSKLKSFTKLGGGITRVFDSFKSAGSEDEVYLVALKKTLESSAFLDKYYRYYEESNNAKGFGVCRVLTDFLNATLLAFVMVDLHMLLERYVKKSKEEWLGPENEWKKTRKELQKQQHEKQQQQQQH